MDFFRTNFDRKFSNFTIALSAARAFGKTTSNGHWVDIIPQIARKANRKQGDPRREMSGTPLLMDLLHNQAGCAIITTIVGNFDLLE